jgi:glycogen debranching enzyme
MVGYSPCGDRTRAGYRLAVGLALFLVLGAGCLSGKSLGRPVSAASKGVHAAPPILVVEGWDHWTRGFAAANQALLFNLDPPHGAHPARHVHAASGVHGVHLWDTAFMSHAWRLWDPHVAQEILFAPMHHGEEGRIPHFVHWFFRSDLTQPPLIAWTVWENHLWAPNDRYLEAVFPRLRAYNAWLYRNRRLPNGLFYWVSPLESGMDNSPRFDAPGRRGAVRDTRNLAAVDLSSYVAADNDALARIADALGLPDVAAEHRASAAGLRASINDLLWDDERGFFFDLDLVSGERIAVRTAAGLIPLFARVPDAERATQLRDHIMDPGRFNTALPLPVVSLDEPGFAKDMWRGPVWINVSYLIVRGLLEYGFEAEAAELAFRTADGVYRTHERTGQLWEFYDTDRMDIAELRRKRGDLWKRLTLGRAPLPAYGWSALANNLVVEVLLGYRRDPSGCRLVPRFPPAASGMRLHLAWPGEGIALSLEVLEDGGARGDVRSGTAREHFHLTYGSELEICHPAGFDRLAPP